MLAGLRHLLMNPWIGPIALAVSVALAAALVVAASMWQTERAGYEARIAELSRASERAQSGLRAELTACHKAPRPTAPARPPCWPPCPRASTLARVWKAPTARSCRT